MLRKRPVIIALIFIALLVSTLPADAQCSICTRTAEQMGEKPAKELNAGILYLAFTPLAIVGFIAFRWWRRNRAAEG
jgi:hypothetical protein